MPEEKITTYDQAARVIGVWLQEFCDDSLPYPERIADASRKASLKISVLENRIKSLAAIAAMPIE